MSSTNESSSLTTSSKMATKAPFERPSMNPIMKIAKLKRSSLSSRLKDDLSYPGSLSGSEHGQSSPPEGKSKTPAVGIQQQNLNGRKLVPISLFPSYYVSKEATNYTKLINILFSTQEKNKSLNFDVKEELEKIKREQEESALRSLAKKMANADKSKTSYKHYRYITSNLSAQVNMATTNVRNNSNNMVPIGEERQDEDVDEYYYYYAMNQNTNQENGENVPMVVNTKPAMSNSSNVVAKVTSIEPVDLATLVSADQGQAKSSLAQNTRATAKSSNINSTNDLVYRLSKKLNSRKVVS